MTRIFVFRFSLRFRNSWFGKAAPTEIISSGFAPLSINWLRIHFSLISDSFLLNFRLSRPRTFTLKTAFGRSVRNIINFNYLFSDAFEHLARLFCHPSINIFSQISLDFKKIIVLLQFKVKT